MSSTNRVEIQRRFKAKPETVYDAWTRPEIIARWWGPEGVSLGEYSFDLTEGGTWRTVMVSPEGKQHIVGGVYRELRRPHRLVTTWAWEEGGTPGESSLVTVTFEPAGQTSGQTSDQSSSEETLMTLVHDRLADKDSAAAHTLGWNSSLNCLEALWT